MATKPYQTKNGEWRFDYTNHHGKRKTFNLGVKHTQESAFSLRLLVENLVLARIQRKEPQRADAEHFAALVPNLRKKLISHDLIDPSKDETAWTIRQLIEEFDKTRSAWKEGTRKCDKRVYDYLLGGFGGERRIDTINQGDVEKFFAWLMSERKPVLCPTTVYHTCRDFKKVFKFAIKSKQLVNNPFDGVKVGTPYNHDDQDFVEWERIEKVLAVCENDPEFQLAIVLARYGTTRINSDIKDLRFSNFIIDPVHPDQSYFTIPITGKTKYREVPLFDIIRLYFEKVRALAPPDQEYVFPKYRVYNSCSTALARAQKKAGVKWKRAFNNLRASRATEFETPEFTEADRDSVIGNTKSVRKGHYVIAAHRRNDVFKRMMTYDRKLRQISEKTSVDSSVKCLVKFGEVIDKIEENSNEYGLEIEQQGEIILDLLEDTSRLIDLSMDKTISPQDKMVSYKDFIGKVLSANEKIKTIGQVGFEPTTKGL